MNDVWPAPQIAYNKIMDTPTNSTITNLDVAAVFDEIAERLEAQGENPFKIKAYRNAVRTLDGLSEPVADIAARGDLRKIPGFGEAIAAKTQEILSTGTCELLERLRGQNTPADEDEGDAALPAAAEDIPAPW